jgi:hypothetical protein
MNRITLGLAVAIVAGAGQAQAQLSSERDFRPATSSICRVTGLDAQGVLRMVTIRADGQQQDWGSVELVVLTECRAAYRLQNCTIVSCRP